MIVLRLPGLRAAGLRLPAFEGLRAFFMGGS